MSAAPAVLAADVARTVGAVTGRLLILSLGLYLLVSGLRRRRDPSTPERGTARILVGAILLFAFLAQVATLSTATSA